MEDFFISNGKSCLADTPLNHASKVNQPLYFYKNAPVKAEGSATSISCKIYEDNNSYKSLFYCQEEKGGHELFIALVTLIVAIASLVLSGLAFYDKLITDKKTRIKSIEDDFWTRDVFSEFCINPLLKAVKSIREDLPQIKINKSAGFDPIKVASDYKVSVSLKAREFSDLATDFSGFTSTFDNFNQNKIIEYFFEIEDLISEFGFSVDEYLKGNSSIPDHKEFITKSYAIQNKIIREIKSYQAIL